MTVAFASTDGRHVEGELRRAEMLVVYEVRPEGAHLDRVSSFVQGIASSEDRIEALAGSAIVYVAAIGPSTAARLAARGIRAATARAGTRIEDLVAALVRALASAGDRPGGVPAPSLAG